MITKILLTLLIVFATAIVLVLLTMKAVIDKVYEDEKCRRCHARGRWTGYKEYYRCDGCNKPVEEK